MSWQAHAACIGHTDLFFADDDDAIELALLICASCPVRDECEAALPFDERTINDVAGVRAGYTEAERRRARKGGGRTRLPSRERARQLRVVQVMTDAGHTANQIAAYLEVSQRSVVRMRVELRTADHEQLLLCS